MVRELKRASGCYRADAEPSGEWTLEASSRAAIERFVAEAAVIIPGCALQLQGETEPPVYELASSGACRLAYADFARVDDLVTVSITAPETVDMRPLPMARLWVGRRRAVGTGPGQ